MIQLISVFKSGSWTSTSMWLVELRSLTSLRSHKDQAINSEECWYLCFSQITYCVLNQLGLGSYFFKKLLGECALLKLVHILVASVIISPPLWRKQKRIRKFLRRSFLPVMKQHRLIVLFLCASLVFLIGTWKEKCRCNERDWKHQPARLNVKRISKIHVVVFSVHHVCTVSGLLCIQRHLPLIYCHKMLAWMCCRYEHFTDFMFPAWLQMAVLSL